MAKIKGKIERLQYNINGTYRDIRRSHADHANKKQKHGRSLDDLYDGLEDTLTLMNELVEVLKCDE